MSELSNGTSDPSNGKNDPTKDADDFRNTIISSSVALLVGILTYFAASWNTQQQVNTALLGHSHDVASALHDNMSDLYSDDARRSNTALASVYFLGRDMSERTQIIESVGDIPGSAIRNEINYLLLVDQTYGPLISHDPNVQAILTGGGESTPEPSPSLTPTPSSTLKPRVATSTPRALASATPKPTSVQSPRHLAESPSRPNDELDQTMARLNGTGWTYLGRGVTAPGGTYPANLEKDHTITKTTIPEAGGLILFERSVNFRAEAPSSQYGFGRRIGTVKKGTSAVVLDTQSWRPPELGQTEEWAQVFLCDSPRNVQRPDLASVCPSQ
jgi:hypothetical protein